MRFNLPNTAFQPLETDKHQLPSPPAAASLLHHHDDLVVLVGLLGSYQCVLHV